MAKCNVIITHTDKFFHNKPRAERFRGTPHFIGIFVRYASCGGLFSQHHFPRRSVFLVNLLFFILPPAERLPASDALHIL